VTLIDVVLVVLKVVVVVIVMMHLAIFLTWADRRQGAMIQDRIGPNRAVIWLPTPIAQGLALGPAFGAAALVAWLAFGHLVGLGEAPEGPARTSAAMMFSQLAIVFTWATAALISARARQRGPRTKFDLWIQTFSPRSIFVAGLVAHVGTLLVGSALRGTEVGLVLADVGYGGGAAVLMFAILCGAGYSAYVIRREKRVGLRLIGLLHAAAVGLKTLWKEDFIPPNADRLLHSLAPIISFFPALAVFAVIPFGDTLCFGLDGDGQLDLMKLARAVPREGMCTDGAVPLQIASLNVGVLYFFALAGTGIVGAALAGWASDNKYSLLGGLRAASQMVSYEVTMGLALIGAMMVYGTLRLEDMVRWQTENTWGIFVQPLAFFLFFAAAVAESKRIPFDLPEGESEIVAGFFVEYSAMAFALFFLGEYANMILMSAMTTILFLGGWLAPFGIEPFTWVPGPIWFILKVCFCLFVFLWVRATFPRYRYDQIMRLGWKALIPVTIVWIFAEMLMAHYKIGPWST